MLCNDIISLWETKQNKFLITHYKWAPVVRHVAPNIDEFFMNDVCWYMEGLSKREVTNFEGRNIGLLTLNLLVILNIKDLSKIIFETVPQSERTYSVRVGVDTDFIGFNPVNIIQDCESLLVRMVCDEINTKIDEGSIINAYAFVESVSVISCEGSPPSIYLCSNMSFN